MTFRDTISNRLNAFPFKLILSPCIRPETSLIAHRANPINDFTLRYGSPLKFICYLDYTWTVFNGAFFTHVYDFQYRTGGGIIYRIIRVSWTKLPMIVEHDKRAFQRHIKRDTIDFEKRLRVNRFITYFILKLKRFRTSIDHWKI